MTRRNLTVTKETRAYQYACAMRGIETRHSIRAQNEYFRYLYGYVQEPHRKTRTKRVTSIVGGRLREPFTIPNWDHVPTIQDHSK